MRKLSYLRSITIHSVMKIVLIGSGNVATHLGGALQKANHQILQVFSRSKANATDLATKLNAEAISNLSDVDKDADVYILSIKDDALESVILSLPQLKGMVVHTAGSVAMDVLIGFDKYGVFYPFQTFTKSTQVDFQVIPILVEGQNKEQTQLLFDLGCELSNNVLKANSYQRGQLHIAAVYACNFTNHMYRLANEVLDKSELPFDLLHPLITETAAKVQKLSPYQTQTGPAARNDKTIIKKHLSAISNNDELSEIYRVLTDSIIRRC